MKRSQGRCGIFSKRSTWRRTSRRDCTWKGGL